MFDGVLISGMGIWTLIGRKRRRAPEKIENLHQTNVWWHTLAARFDAPVDETGATYPPAIRRVRDDDRRVEQTSLRRLGRCNRLQQRIVVFAFGVGASTSLWLPSPPRRGRVVLAFVAGEKGWG